jgi:hypothetical protein
VHPDAKALRGYHSSAEVAKWLDVKADLEGAEGKALLDYSKLPCALGGTIAFAHHGQAI